METVIYITPVYKIGKTEWRMMVYEKNNVLYLPSETGKDHFMQGTHRFTRYQYNDYGTWKNETDHPRYDSNDGSYAGLPKGLKKIFYNHEQEIKESLFVAPENRNLREI